MALSTWLLFIGNVVKCTNFWKVKAPNKFWTVHQLPKAVCCNKKKISPLIYSSPFLVCLCEMNFTSFSTFQIKYQMSPCDWPSSNKYINKFPIVLLFNHVRHLVFLQCRTPTKSSRTVLFWSFKNVVEQKYTIFTLILFRHTNKHASFVSGFLAPTAMWLTALFALKCVFYNAFTPKYFIYMSFQTPHIQSQEF